MLRLKTQILHYEFCRLDLQSMVYLAETHLSLRYSASQRLMPIMINRLLDWLLLYKSFATVGYVVTIPIDILHSVPFRSFLTALGPLHISNS